MALLMIILLFLSSAFASDVDTVKDKFKVYDIIELDKYYLILAIKDDNLYRILSTKPTNAQDCDSIIQLNKYALFNLKKIEIYSFGRLEDCNCFYGDRLAFVYLIDNNYITLPGCFDSNIYLGLNISGKCYVN